MTGNDISFTRVGQVPAGEGVLLRATGVFGEEEATKTFTIPITTGVTAWADSDNDFIRGGGAAVASESDGYYNYILNVVSGEAGFYKANGQNVASNRAYLRTTAAPAASRMGMSFSEEPTSVRPIDNSLQTKADYYNLNGQRIQKPAKGIFVIRQAGKNGKKVVIK